LLKLSETGGEKRWWLCAFHHWRREISVVLCMPVCYMHVDWALHWFLKLLFRLHPPGLPVATHHKLYWNADAFSQK